MKERTRGAAAPRPGGTSPAVVLVDAAGRVTAWTPAAEALFAVPAALAVGRALGDVAPCPLEPRVAAEVAAEVAAGRPWEGVFAVAGGDGPVSVDAAVVPLGPDGAAGTVWVLGAFPGREAGARLGQVLAAERAARHAGRSAERWWSALRSGGVPSGPDTLDTLLRRSLEAVRTALGSDTASVLLTNDAGDELVVRASVGFPSEVNREVRIPAGAGMAGRVLTAGSAQVFPDLDRVAVVSPDLRHAGLRSVVAAPLLGAERTLGVIHAGARRRDAFGAVDAEILAAFADRLTVAVEGTMAILAEREARAEAERALDRLGRLQRITTVLSHTLSVDDVARVVLDELGDALGGGNVSRVLWRCTEEGLVLVRADDAPATARAGFTTMALDGPWPGAAVVADRRPRYFSSRPELDAAFPAMVGHPALGQSFAALPLVAGGRVLGLLSVSYARPRAFDDGTRSFLEAVAVQCAGALDRAVVVDQERSAQRRLAIVAEATRLLGSSLDPTAVLRQLADLVVGNLADACEIMVATATGLSRVVVAGADPGVAERIRREPELPRDSDTTAARALRTARSQQMAVSADTVAALPFGADHRRWLAERIGAVLSVPMAARGETVGVMTFLVGRERSGFRPGDVELAEELAARAGVALDNARRFQREHDVAEVLQRAVLPEHLPPVEGMFLDAVYRAGTTGSYAGGDWYDAIALPDGRLFLSVGDVMGKGPAAAALMGQLRAALRVHAVAGDGPASALAGVDRLFAALGEDRLVTAVVCVLDPATGSAVVSNAGHPPPLVVGVDGRHRLVDAGRSLILGARAAPERSDHAFDLALGDSLVLYSDGLVERRREPIDVGLRRLAEAVAATGPPAGPGDGWAAALADRLGVASADDDVVVMTVHRPSGGGAPATVDPDPGRLVLEPRLAVVPEARRWVRARLAGAAPAVTDTAVLLTSELVTNAVLHAGTEVAVRAGETAGGVRVAVEDRSPAPPAPRRFEPDATTGRGLVLVEHLASRWGVDAGPDGKVVWVEIDDPAGTPAPGPDAADRPADGPVAAGLGGQRPVVLYHTPVGALLRAFQAYEGIFRELRLLVERRPGLADAAPGQLLDALDRLAACFAGSDTAAAAAFEAAVADGTVHIDLAYELPLAVGPAGEACDRLLDEAEAFARAEGMLGPLPDDEAVAVRKWLLWELVRQAEGGDPVPWPDSTWARRLEG